MPTFAPSRWIRLLLKLLGLRLITVAADDDPSRVATRLAMFAAGIAMVVVWLANLIAFAPHACSPN